MTLPVEIARLVETFERNRESYAQGRYSETQLRREYIDPFFKALGWDVDNTRGWAEAYKDVIDTQAVEVTKLSLLLRVLEGEKNLVLFHNERALPDLAGNIRCGNSLIGPDFYKGQQLGIFDQEEQFRINAFDWHAEFPEAFKDGGFDAVIGNPPYVRIQTMQQTQADEVEYYGRRYASAEKGNYDIYIVFIECAVQLLNKGVRVVRTNR